MEGLSFDNILGEQEIETLFTDPNDTEIQENNTKQEEEGIEDSPADNKGKKYCTIRQFLVNQKFPNSSDYD